MSDTDVVTIPDAKNVPETGDLPPRFGKINNLAGDAELVKKVRGYLSTMLERHRTQEQRKNFCDDGGVMDVADRMARVALRRDTASAQYQATLSDVACTAFLKGIRAMTAGENSVYFQSDELPAEYEPLGKGVEYRENESKPVTDQRQIIEEYVWNRDNRREKIRKATYFNNKYGQGIFSIEWDYRVEKKMERVQNEDGGFDFKEVERTIADNPTLIWHDLKNMYFDAQIDDMQSQQCILEEGDIPYRFLLADQESGHLMNVEKISDSSLAYQDYNTETIDARSKNAGESATQQVSGLIKRWNCWAWLPIKEGKNGKGEWDPTVVTKLYWVTFAGQLNSDGPCLRLIENPYFHGRNPYFMWHAYSADDKGAYHLSPAETVLSLYWQAVTCWNQAHDNITLRNRAPYIADGPVLTRDLTFKANKLIRVDRGVQLKPIEVKDTTTITLPMAEKLEEDIYSTLGTDKPILGIPFLGRTSASEATTAYEQARVPLLQKADDNANELFSWMFEMDALLMEQYADPELILGLTKENLQVEFKPSKIYGPFKVKITAITNYESRMQRRRAMNAFLQAGYQFAAPIMGKQGELVFWHMAWSELGFKKGDEIFPPSGDYDATRVAVNESHNMLRLHQYDEVEAEDNHRAHLAVHQAALSEYQYLPEADQNADDERRMMGHIQKHKNYMMQGSSIQGQQQKQLTAGQAMPGEEGGAGMIPGLPGEQAANPMEAEAGAEANL